MKFLVPHYSCLQNPWLRGLPPPDPGSLCPQLNLLNPPEQNSWVRHWLLDMYRPCSQEAKGHALRPQQIWLNPSGICSISKTNMQISPLKELATPYRTHVLPLAVNNSFSKMCVGARWFVQCYRARYVISCWLCGPDSGTFSFMHRIYTYIHTHCTCSALYTYVRSSTRTGCRHGNCVHGLAKGLDM